MIEYGRSDAAESFLELLVNNGLSLQLNSSQVVPESPDISLCIVVVLNQGQGKPDRTILLW